MSQRQAFPRRDPSGRVVMFVDLFAVGLAMLLLSLVIVLVVDLVSVAFGAGFGQSSGWLALILPCWLFVEEFRAWRGVPGRAAFAALVGLVSLLAGLAAAFAANYLPPLLSGGVGAFVTTFMYSTLWFYGIRSLEKRSGGGR